MPAVPTKLPRAGWPGRGPGKPGSGQPGKGGKHSGTVDKEFKRALDVNPSLTASNLQPWSKVKLPLSFHFLNPIQGQYTPHGSLGRVYEIRGANHRSQSAAKCLVLKSEVGKTPNIIPQVPRRHVPLRPLVGIDQGFRSSEWLTRNLCFYCV